LQVKIIRDFHKVKNSPTVNNNDRLSPSVCQNNKLLIRVGTEQKWDNNNMINSTNTLPNIRPKSIRVANVVKPTNKKYHISEKKLENKVINNTCSRKMDLRYTNNKENKSIITIIEQLPINDESCE